MNRVYLLGAGFSRAISAEMPMMNELSAAVQAGLPDLPGASTPLAKNFEQWLSYLIDIPPWLSHGDQLRNQGAFNDVARAVHSVLDERQTAAVTHGACPAWLEKLVVHWHKTAATVITFNYDLLVELAWHIQVQNKSIDLTRIYPVPLTYIASRTGTVLGDLGRHRVCGCSNCTDPSTGATQDPAARPATSSMTCISTASRDGP